MVENPKDRFSHEAAQLYLFTMACEMGASAG